MADPSQSWWKVTFLQKKKSQPKVLYEIPTETVSNSAPCVSGTPLHSEGPVQDARLEKIVDRNSTGKGRHVKVSQSGKFKEKKKVRPTLADNPDMFSGDKPVRGENQRIGK